MMLKIIFDIYLFVLPLSFALKDLTFSISLSRFIIVN